MSDYKWDPNSAGRKLASDININISVPLVPGVSVNKSFPITGPHNPTTDAYRCCSNCGKHWNYHVGNKCPK